MDNKNIFDFESKFKLLSEDKIDMSKDIKSQSKFLDSDILNNNFSNIENNLNTLYEKMRILEELIDYAKIYVKTEIDTTIGECRGLLNEIENMNDLNFNDTKNYTVTNIPLVNNDSAQYTDRDGSVLKTCETFNNVLSLSGTLKESIDVNSVNIESSEQVYERNAEALQKKEAYRTHYLLDDASNGGVTETITFSFSDIKTLNSIKVKIANCNINSIIYIHEDNTESVDYNTSTGTVPTRDVKAIKLVINCKNYSAKTVSVNASEEDSFDKLAAAWKDVHDEVSKQDLSNSSAEFKSSITDYLENIYLSRKE